MRWNRWVCEEKVRLRRVDGEGDDVIFLASSAALVAGGNGNHSCPKIYNGITK